MCYYNRKKAKNQHEEIDFRQLKKMYYNLISNGGIMIKTVAFDLVGVLVKEKDIQLTDLESKLERLFGPNISDLEYLNDARKIVNDENLIKNTTKNIINKLYEIKYSNLLDNLRNKYPNIKLVLATNHLSMINDYINKKFFFDNIFISADMHKIKPNNDFYYEIIDKMNCNPNEILFLDDNKDNIEGASNCGLITILVDKNMDLYEEIKIKLKH